MINHDPHKNKVKIIHFFNKLKIIRVDTIPEINLIIMQQIIFHQIMRNTTIKFLYDFIQSKDLVLTVLTNQIFSNHTHEMSKYDNLELIQHLPTTILNNKTQLKHNLNNHLKCITKFHCHIEYNNMK